MNARLNSSMVRLAVGLRFSYVLYTWSGFTYWHVRQHTSEIFRPRQKAADHDRLDTPPCHPRPAGETVQPWVCNKIRVISHGVFRECAKSVRYYNRERAAIRGRLRDIPLTFPKAAKIILKCPRWPDVIAGGTQLTPPRCRRLARSIPPSVSR